MKKYLPFIIIAVIAIAGIGYALTRDKGNSKSAENGGISSNEKSANKYSDACKVFTTEDLAVALGGTYAEGEEGIAANTAAPGSDNYDDLKGSACEFDQVDDGTTAGMTAALNFSINVNNYASSDDADKFMKDLHDPQTAEGQEALAGEPVDVAGVGDQAFFPRISTAAGTDEKTEALYVRLGKQIIVLNATRLNGVDRPAVQASLTKLAQKL
ncbi:MAG: hypothetical protein U0520_03425 [Candidatus Saccharimonadales bacterium]